MTNVTTGDARSGPEESGLPANAERPNDDPLPHARFTLDGVPEKERYDLWRDSISCIFEVEAEREIRQGPFEASIDASLFGSIMLARTQTLEQRWSRTPALMAKDGMDHYMIQVYEHGDMLWETPDGARSFPKHGLVIFDLAEQVVTRTNNFSNLSLFIPRATLDEQLKDRGNQHLRALTAEEPIVHLLRDHMVSLKSLSSRMTARQATEISPATIGLAAACLNAVISPDDQRQSSGVSMARMTTIRRLIEANLGNSELGVDWITGKVGLSRTKLYELFEQLGGVANYIRERRLRRALIMLTDKSTAHLSIYDIALEASYTSDAAFVRAFRARYGVTPGDVRAAGHRLLVAEGMKTPGVDRRHEAWVHNL